MLEIAHSPHFGLLTKHGLSASAAGWAQLWALGVAGGTPGQVALSAGTSGAEQEGAALGVR